ncbi:MAG: D-erythro-7,8-dihydroneopterin triphosphate epimerase [Candidatus Paceibacteria bacterium]|jgi:D-erythro-7,8-dihydroneopterin triphosphate epimerase
MDKIHIEDLHLRCIIGIYPEERTKKQDVLIQITIHADLSSAGASDRVEDTVDYKAIKNGVVEFVEGSECMLLERLAQEIATLCLQDPGVVQVDVRADKPGALRYAKTVGVEISRTKKDQEP